MGRTMATQKEIPSVVPKKIRYDSLRVIEPLTQTQEEVFREYQGGQNLLLHGYAGTGKTFLACYLAFREVLLRESGYEKVVVVRSAVPTRDQGFLPGDKDEKELVYQLPYQAIFKEIFYDHEAFSKLIHQELYEFISTSYIRGITLRRSIVIVDEIENMTYSELSSVITRLGHDCKVIFCGDYRQTDLQRHSDKEGLVKFMKILNEINTFSHVEFTKDDIVRGDLVKNFIIAEARLEDESYSRSNR